MEDLLMQERAADEHVRALLKGGNATFGEINATFTRYRALCQEAIFADFHHVEARERALWDTHQLGRKSFHKALQHLRKEQKDRPVETRELVKLFLGFLKQSQRYYREYIYRLSKEFGGIHELEAIAHKVKEEEVGESLHVNHVPELRKKAVESCHRTLVYLGDLCRYRASEQLDNVPDFGPAIGYYELAAVLVPSSGMGHHQQAVIFLEQRSHLRAIYHLYRAICVPDPHPNAANNIVLEFGKTITAWDKGELIRKGAPNDPDVPYRALEGWFVRLHSMCYKGELFRGYEELEREVVSQLSSVIKQQRSPEHLLMRIIITNIAAQSVAGERFQANPSTESSQSLLYYFRFNLKTFMTLLCVFADDLRSTMLNLADQDADLSARLSPTSRRLLPCLRVYSNWLIPNIHFLTGLSTDDFVGDSVQQFWPQYARTIDLICQAFPIWELEDLAVASYMLEEDVDTLAFKPLTDNAVDRMRRTWFDKATGSVRPRFSDRDVMRVSEDEEMLQRVYDFLTDGLYIANDEETAPIKILGTRIFSGHEENIEALVLRPVEVSTAQPSLAEQKPVSYATVAANGHARQAQPAPMARTGSIKNQSRDAQLSRMVDDLVEDDEANNPVTPPQPIASHPVVVEDTPCGMQDSVYELTNGSKYMRNSTSAVSNPVAPRLDLTATPPGMRLNGSYKSSNRQHNRMKSVSKLWNDDVQSSPFPGGLPTGTLTSPGGVTMHSHHSRVNSASSIRSRKSMVGTDQRTSSELTSRIVPDGNNSNSINSAHCNFDQSSPASPFLFGAGGGMWGAHAGYRNISPPNGQGG